MVSKVPYIFGIIGLMVLADISTIASYNQIESEKFQKELHFFRALDQNNSDVFYLEYLKDWDSKYELFFDPIHLNPEGQKALTKALSLDLKFLVDDGVSRI